jgi:hypothetical protein
MENKVVFSIDGGNADFTFVGYASPRRWNGWSIPYFNKTTIEKIISKSYLFQNEESESILSFEDGVLYETYDGEKIEICDGVMMHGETHYCFDNGWCWEVDKVLSRMTREIQSIVDDVTFTDKEVMDEMYSYLIDVRERGIVVETYTNGRTQALMTINAINQFINQ